MKTFAKALSLGIKICAGIMIPVLIGVYADQYFSSKPIGVLIGFVIGMLCAFGTLRELTLP